MTYKAKLLHSVFLALALLMIAPVFGTTGILFGSSAAQAQTVSNISVTGNVRVDDATVISYLSLRPGQPASAAAIQSSIDQLNSSGLFETVSVSMSGSTLNVRVTERSVVSTVLFEGNQRFNDTQLSNMVDAASRGVYTEAGLANDVRTIQAAYDQAGYTNVSVTTRTEPTSDGRMRVVFVINEGDRAGVAAINFTGNNSISSNQLKAVIQTKESHFLSFLFRDDIYDADRLAVDRELIRIYYANRGFPDARVLSAVADFDAQRNAYFVNFTIDEGERYSFGNVGIETSIAGLNTDSLRGSVRTGAGSRYSLRELQESTQNLALNATRQGYSFAEVRPRIDRDVTNRTFNVTYLVDEGARVYVERINITGNTKTRDFVIRREFDFAEGDPFNRSLVNRARQSIEDLGFFSAVNITAEQGSAADRVILNVQVVESSTGEYGVTAGYSTEDGLLGEISLTERNFLGRGQYLRVALGASEAGRTFDFSFTEPRFMGLRVSAGVDVYRRLVEEGRRFSYGIDTQGAQLRFGLPIIDDLSLTTFVGFEQKNFIDDEEPFAPAYIAENPTLDKLQVGYSLNYSTVDNTRRPTEGLVASFTQTYAGLSHNLLKSEARARYYYPLWEEFGVVGSIRGQAGIINDLGDSGIHPTEAFNLGPTFVRGFQPAGIGPRLTSTGDATGYLSYAGLSAEIDFPLPVVPETWGLRGAVFADMGIIDGIPAIGSLETTGMDQTFKSSVGGSLIWDSPFGPLRGDFAHVIDKDTADRTQLFQLTLSTLF